MAQNSMADCFTVEKRSAVMSAVRHENTAAEIKLCKTLWRLGLRYRKHLRVRGVRPDIVFTRCQVAVFVDGCFWHGCPVHYVSPESNKDFWRAKLEKNVARDSHARQLLEEAGWRVLRFWECEVNRELDRVANAVSEIVRKEAQRS